MRRNGFLIRTLTAALFFSSFFTAFFPGVTAYGVEEPKEFISIDDAVELSKKNSSELKKIDYKVKELDSQRSGIRKIKKTIEDSIEICKTAESDMQQSQTNIAELNQQLKSLDPLDPLYSDKAAEIQAKLDEENNKLAGLNAQMAGAQAVLISFGINSYDLSKKGEYNKIIQPYDFAIYDLDASIDSLSINRQAAENGVEVGAKLLYSQISSLNDASKLQGELYENKQKEYEGDMMKYKYGLISEIERLESEKEFKNMKFDIDKINRNIDNISMSLKKMMGISLATSINLEPYNGYEKDLQSYYSYLNEALENRSEIIAAKIDLRTKQKELDITGDYMGESSDEYKSMKLSVHESEISLKEAQNSVNKDIKTGYADALKKKKALEIAQEKEKSLSENYKSMKLYHELGYVTKTQLLDTEAAYDNAQDNIISARRDYYDSLLKLEYASKIGPQYSNTAEGSVSTKMGGN